MILGRMKRRSRQRVTRQLKKIVQGYVTSTSVLYDYLGTSIGDETFQRDSFPQIDHNVMNIVSELDENITTIGNTDYFEPLSTDHEESNECCEDICSSDNGDNVDSEDDSAIEEIIDEASSFNEENTNIPNWLLEYARRGRIHSCVIDILSLRQYFCPPQVEDYSLTPSHYISLPILNFIVGILVGDSEFLFKYWTRSNSSLVWYTLEPSCKTASLTFPPCNDITNISDSARKNILLEITGIYIELSQLPEEWHLFVISVIFWLKNMKEPAVSEAYFHTIIMCLVAIYTIDLKIGVHRNKQSFSRKYKNLLNKLIESKTKEKNNLKHIKVPDSSSNIKSPKGQSELLEPINELAQVSHEDCVLVFETILPYHHLNDNIKSKPKQFCSYTIHAFAQFQSILFHVMVLNSVLGFPFKEPIISHLYSGVFVYNMCSNLSKKSNLVACVESLFQGAPSLLRLYKSLIGLLEEPLAEIELLKYSKKNNKKKRRSKQQLILQDDNARDKVEVEDDFFYDENNVFSRLSINA